MYPAEDQRLSQRPIIHIAVQSDVERLPAFQGLPNQAIVMPASAEAFSAAAQELLACACIGFDTESKPTFRVGEVSSGPHLIQFATPAKAYLLRVGLPGSIEAARTVLQAAQVVKIGFGLKSDRSRLHQRLGIHAHSLLDLGSLLRYQGKKGQVGLRGAVAAVLGRQIDKSRRLATSNWANPLLTEAQQAYAANDAYAALQVFLALPAEHQQELLMAAQRAQNATADATLDPLVIRWQRLVNDSGQTCDRCGATEQAVRQASRRLQQALRRFGVRVRVEACALTPADFSRTPLESNRIWIAGVPLERWLGAAHGQSKCCSACGEANCRTLELNETRYEAVPAALIVQAGLLAAQRLLGHPVEAPVAPSLPDDGCCA